MRTLLRWIGENPGREGLLDTPKRVVKAYEQFFAGYHQDADEILGTVFEEVEGYDDLVLANLEAAGLARVDAVAIDFARGWYRAFPDVLDHPLYRLGAGPAFIMDSSIDHDPSGAKQHRLKIADASDGVLFIAAEFIGDLFRIKRPAFCISGEAHDAAEG